MQQKLTVKDMLCAIFLL